MLPRSAMQVLSLASSRDIVGAAGNEPLGSSRVATLGLKQPEP